QADKEKREREARALTLSEKQRELERLQAAARVAQADAEKAAEASQREAVRYKALPPASAEGLQKLDDAIKDAQVLRSHQGLRLAVRYAASPTGRVLLDWSVDWKGA